MRWPKISTFATRVIAVLIIPLAFWAIAGDDRNLSKYDKIGPFEFTRENKKDWPRLEAEMREFLWSHWRKRRRGWLSAIHQSVDARSKYTYYVEPTDGNQWCIRISAERARAFIPPPDWKEGPRVESEQIEACKLERIELTTEHNRPPTVIPEKATRGGETFQLEFYDENGQVAHRL